MGLFEIILLAFALSMDAFAVAICAGLSMSKISVGKMVIVGLYFGCFQAVMPLIGYLTASLFTDRIFEYSHWIAFGLLGFLGVKMIIDSLKKDGCPDRKCPDEKCNDRPCPHGKNAHNKEQSLKPTVMLPLAVATSIDALAVGVSFAILKVYVVIAILIIGIITFFVSIAGVKIGNVFGGKYKSKAQLAGGIILLLLGLNILLL